MPKRIPATTPKSVALREPSLFRPSSSSAKHASPTRTSATAHSPFGALSLPLAGSPKIAYRASPMTTTIAPTISRLPTCWAVTTIAERQGEDDGRHEQRLDDRDAPVVEGDRLCRVPGQKHRRAARATTCFA